MLTVKNKRQQKDITMPQPLAPETPRNNLSMEEINTAFDELRPKLLPIARKYASLAYPAEDILEDTALKVLQFHTYYDSQQSFRAWVVTILKNVVRDYYKSPKSQLVLPLLVAQDVADVEGIATNKIFAEYAFNLIRKKFPDTVDIVYGTAMGKSSTELSKELGLSVSCIRKRLFRMRRWLVKHLGEEASVLQKGGSL